MTATDDDNANTTWRDLADQLTPKQTDELNEPEGATRVHPGGDGTYGQGWSREFIGTKRKVRGVHVVIEGTQFADGRAAREIYVTVSDLGETAMSKLDAGSARLLASKLIEAADESERLSIDDVERN